MSDPTAIVELAQTKTFLKIRSDDTSNDVTLQLYIDAATRWATYVSDAIIPKTFTNEIHSGGGSTIVLFNTPILEVESVTEYWNGVLAYTLVESERGDATSPYSFSVDNASAGILTRLWNGWPGNFVGARGQNNIVVTYKAGFETIPADIQLAVLMDIQGLWNQTQYGGNLAGDTAFADTFSVAPMSAFPRLASLLTSSLRVPAVG